MVVLAVEAVGLLMVGVLFVLFVLMLSCLLSSTANEDNSLLVRITDS